MRLAERLMAPYLISLIEGLDRIGCHEQSVEYTCTQMSLHWMCWCDGYSYTQPRPFPPSPGAVGFPGRGGDKDGHCPINNERIRLWKVSSAYRLLIWCATLNLYLISPSGGNPLERLLEKKNTFRKAQSESWKLNPSLFPLQLHWLT